MAIRTFRFAIQLEPNFPDAYNNLGNALRENGELEVGLDAVPSAWLMARDLPRLPWVLTAVARDLEETAAGIDDQT